LNIELFSLADWRKSMNNGQLPPNYLPETKMMPDPVMVSRQIDGLREVLRRMRTSQTTTTLDKLISQKLQKVEG
jgi:hypothetical protein